MSLIPSTFFTPFDLDTGLGMNSDLGINSDLNFGTELMPRLDRMLRAFETGAGVGATTGTDLTRRLGSLTNPLSPTIDISDNDKEMVVHADLPGVKKEDIDIEVVNNRLVIKGETKDERETSDDRWRRRERSYGRFERRIALPRDANPNQVMANYNNGVLEVKVAKAPQQQQNRKTITVQ